MLVIVSRRSEWVSPLQSGEANEAEEPSEPPEAGVAVAVVFRGSSVVLGGAYLCRAWEAG